MPKRAPQREARRPRLSDGRRHREGSALRTVFAISAGGVIYRRGRHGIEICLIATRGATRWQLPKGKREPGETLEVTAAREVAEETGLVGVVGPRLDKLDLWFTSNTAGQVLRHHKLVYFYLLAYSHGSTRNHDHEVDDARWFAVDEAMARLTFPSERRVVARALALITPEGARSIA
jgi:8-oxo-dGTP pyrophosphatase MutT (NUDIX family)